MVILDIPQRSEEWYSAKCGIPSSSCFSQIVTSKGAKSKSAEGYMYELAGQRITGKIEDSYVDADIQRGINSEEEARDLFEIIKGINVEQVGVCLDDKGKYLCSPDGLISVDGPFSNTLTAEGVSSGIEIKCPKMKTQAKRLIENVLPSEYFHQVQGSMLITGTSHWYFMSYYPAMPPLIIRVERDAVFCVALKNALDQFCADLDSLTEQIRNMI